MKKFISFPTLLLATVMFLIASTNMSCLKETDCTAIITVLNQSSGQPVVGAQVKLDCGTCVPPGNLQSDIQNTDASGKTNHVFKYPAVLDITVTSGQGTATGVIKLEEGESTEKTIYL